MSGWCILHLALCGYVFYVMYWRCYWNSSQVNVVRCLSCPASASASYNSPELLQRWNPPSQQSSTLGSISRRLRSSCPLPTAKSAGASSPANPITLRSTWLRQRGCTLVASLFYSTCYIYCPLSTHSNEKYDYFILLYDKEWGTRQLSYPWWTLLNAIIIYLCVLELCICRWAWELS